MLGTPLKASENLEFINWTEEEYLKLLTQHETVVAKYSTVNHTLQKADGKLEISHMLHDQVDTFNFVEKPIKPSTGAVILTPHDCFLYVAEENLHRFSYDEEAYAQGKAVPYAWVDTINLLKLKKSIDVTSNAVGCEDQIFTAPSGMFACEIKIYPGFGGRRSSGGRGS